MTQEDVVSQKMSNWGRWGPEDERGALNLITPQMVTKAAASVRTGRVYSLGIPIQAEGVPIIDYRGKPMRLTLQDTTDEGVYSSYDCPPGTGANEDVMVFASHTTSHMDALIHVYADGHHYNGVPASAMRARAGATRLGIEKVGGFAARAVLLDMPRYFGDADWVDPGRKITGDDLAGACALQEVEVLAGDVVLVRTGYLQMWYADHGASRRGQPGIGLDAASWLAAKDIVAVGSDNAGVEGIPFDGNEFLAVHKLLLVRLGIYMLEFLDLSGPARDRAWEGLLAVAPLKVTGATGSPINPIFVA
jgi:kynurenine formamidase